MFGGLESNWSEADLWGSIRGSKGKSSTKSASDDSGGYSLLGARKSSGNRLPNIYESDDDGKIVVFSGDSDPPWVGEPTENDVEDPDPMPRSTSSRGPYKVAVAIANRDKSNNSESNSGSQSSLDRKRHRCCPCWTAFWKALEAICPAKLAIPLAVAFLFISLVFINVIVARAAHRGMAKPVNKGMSPYDCQKFLHNGLNSQHHARQRDWCCEEFDLGCTAATPAAVKEQRLANVLREEHLKKQVERLLSDAEPPASEMGFLPL
mmetsp:Transcript_15161/g.32706  ORF Transcript_15161/g.32706 Transcript_15161/m.32706 type:complete len:264 (-) Transcript_15161:88-879(-)